jgi:hypothetical protein
MQKPASRESNSARYLASLPSARARSCSASAVRSSSWATADCSASACCSSSAACSCSCWFASSSSSCWSWSRAFASASARPPALALGVLVPEPVVGLLAPHGLGHVLDVVQEVADRAVGPEHRDVARRPVAHLPRAVRTREVVALHGHRVRRPRAEDRLERRAQVRHAARLGVLRVGVGEHLEQRPPERPLARGARRGEPLVAGRQHREARRVGGEHEVDPRGRVEDGAEIGDADVIRPGDLGAVPARGEGPGRCACIHARRPSGSHDQGPAQRASGRAAEDTVVPPCTAARHADAVATLPGGAR